MKRFIALILAAVLALPSVGVPTVALSAARFHAFCPGGVPSKEELARRMDASVRADPTGHTPLAGCRANPIQFLEAFRQGNDPGAGPQDIRDIGRYIREDLVPVTVEQGIQYYSSCIRGRSRGADDVIMRCQPQMIPANVQVFADRHTSRMVLKLDCANPGLVPVAPAPDPCAYDRFHVGSDTEKRAHVFTWGPGGTSDRCWGYRRVGESEWRDITPSCPRGPCSATGADRRVAPRQRTFTGTIEGLTPGDYEIRVERQAFAENDESRLGVCLENELPDRPRGRISSYTAVLGPTHYQLEGERWVARVAYTDSDVPEGTTQTQPGGVYFYQTR